METDSMTEFDTLWISAVFAANAELQVGSGLFPLLYRQFHQLAYAFLIDGLERIGFKNALFYIGSDDIAGVVSGQAEDHLC